MRMILQMSAIPMGRNTRVFVSVFDADQESFESPVWRLQYTSAIECERRAGQELLWLAAVLWQLEERVKEESTSTARTRYADESRRQRENVWRTANGLEPPTSS